MLGAGYSVHGDMVQGQRVNKHESGKTSCCTTPPPPRQRSAVKFKTLTNPACRSLNPLQTSKRRNQRSKQDGEFCVEDMVRDHLPRSSLGVCLNYRAAADTFRLCRCCCCGKL